MATSPDTSLRRTPLFEQHLASGARMTPFAGYEMPLAYSGQIAEHKAVRSAVGMFDVSHMGQIVVRGRDASRFLDFLLPGDVGTLALGQSRYTQLLNEQGGVLDDLIVSHSKVEEEYFIVVNAATREKDIDWMLKQAGAYHGDVLVEDGSEQWAMIAVQGPDALPLLEALAPPGTWADTPAFTLHHFVYQGHQCLLSRTGYTGEMGAELLVPPAIAGQWWDRLLAEGVLPCGLAARDTLRLEAGYCLYGQDLNEETTPVEASLSWSVGWKKEGNFIGRAALERQRLEGAPRKLIGLRAEGRRPLRRGDAVMLDEKQVGEVTSGGFSPLLECGIALAYVAAEALGDHEYAMESKGRSVLARPAKPPFVNIGLKKT